MKNAFFIFWALLSFAFCGSLSSESPNGVDGFALVVGIICGGALTSAIFLIIGLFIRIFSGPKEVFTGKQSQNYTHRTPTNLQKSNDGLAIVRAIKFIFIAGISFPLVCCIFSDELYEANGRIKATPTTLLDLKSPPRVFESITVQDAEQLPHYKKFYDLNRYVTLYSDDSYGYLFLINANFVFSHSEKKDAILHGYDKDRKKLYGFQLNIFDPEVTKQMTMEKAVVLAGRYIPNHVVNGVRSETYFNEAPWATFYCLETKCKFNLMIADIKNEGWVIYGSDHQHSVCKKGINSQLWDVNFEDLFARGNEHLFIKDGSREAEILK